MGDSPASEEAFRSKSRSPPPAAREDNDNDSLMDSDDDRSKNERQATTLHYDQGRQMSKLFPEFVSHADRRLGPSVYSCTSLSSA